MTIFLAGTTGQSHKQSDFGKLFLAKSLVFFYLVTPFNYVCRKIHSCLENYI